MQAPGRRDFGTLLAAGLKIGSGPCFGILADMHPLPSTRGAHLPLTFVMDPSAETRVASVAVLQWSGLSELPLLLVNKS